MDKNIKPQINIFQVLLILLILLSLIPAFILIIQSMNNLDRVKSLSKKTVETSVKQQTVQMYKTYSQNLAQRISEFLYSCELDLEDFSKLPAKQEIYLNFSKKHQRLLSSKKSIIPVYKELSLVDKNGNQIIKIGNNQIIPKDQLKNIGIPQNTTFKSEIYFKETKSSDMDIYVSHLTGWYVSRQEQLEQGKSYSGVIRFCKKLKDKQGRFAGICMLALDHCHLMDIMWDESTGDTSLINIYKTGNYNYIIDDEGWIITHPKLWDIRGLDKNGTPVESLTEHTPKWKVEAGVIPMNLIKMDWRLRDIYTDEPISSVINRVQRGETVLSTMTSSGIFLEFKSLIRTRAYAPINYNSGSYSKHGIFGIVVFGKSLEVFLNNARVLTKEIDNINEYSKKRMLLIAVIIFIAIIIFSLIVAKSMAAPLQKLNKALARIGEGNFVDPEVNSSIKEIRELSLGVQSLTNDLKDKDEKINLNLKDLEIVNRNLAELKTELDSYLKHEYETESDIVLEEKIKFYEKEYPALKEIRKNIYVGKSLKFLRVLRQIVPLSQMNIPTWIYGESGVGKTILARAIHLLSPRSEKPFQAFAASEFAAADPVIVLGKLFGYGPGHGLRGINKNGQKGIIEECHGGTLLIDDVDALPAGTQAQLLRVVDGLSFHPAAGKSLKITSDVRFIFTTNMDLEKLVNDKLFRKDLFRRMGGSINKIEIPPLRDLRPDIPLLAKYFIDRYCERYDVNLQIKEETLNLLANHDFAEGNIGELKMLIELACENTRIENETYISIERFHKIAAKEKQKPGDKITAFSSSVFNEKECKEVEVLRRNNFHMEASEEELGFKRGSRILSHHLRGICLKALCGTEWNIEEASKLITGSDNLKINSNIIRRIKGYIKNISEKGMTNQKESLFSHLPKEYHSFLFKALSRFNKSS